MVLDNWRFWPPEKKQRNLERISKWIDQLIWLQTVRNLHFLSKNSTLLPREKLSSCFGWKTRENAAVLDFVAVDTWQRWFHEKNCQKNFGWKTCENVGDLHFLLVDKFNFPKKIAKFCQNQIFGQKFDF